MPSEPVMTSTSSSRPASATAPRPPGPTAPSACASSTSTRTSCRRASSDDVLERRDVAVEAEHAVGRDQRAAAVALREAPGQVLGVGVLVGERLRAGQPAAVDDRRVRELVVEDHLALARQRRDDAEVGERPEPKTTVASRAEEAGEPLLEPPVQRHRPRRHLRRPGAHAPAHGRVGGRLTHARVIGEPEAVARAQHQHRPPVEHHPRALWAAHHAGAAIEAELLELVQAVVEIQHPRSFGKAEDVPRATVRRGPDGSALAGLVSARRRVGALVAGLDADGQLRRPLEPRRVTGFAALAPFSRAFTLPLTLTVADTTLAPAGALTRSVSLPRLDAARRRRHADRVGERDRQRSAWSSARESVSA